MTKQRFDLVVRNGIIVTPSHRERADVGITGGRIAQLGGTMTGAGRQLIQAGRGAVRNFPDARTVGAEVTAV